MMMLADDDDDDDHDDDDDDMKPLPFYRCNFPTLFFARWETCVWELFLLKLYVIGDIHCSNNI